MKTKVLVIRLTNDERERLEEEAKAVNKSVSEYARFLIFDKKDNDDSPILKQLFFLQEGQQQQLKYLEIADLRSRKHLRHDVILSASIFQIRYVTAKIVSLLCQIYSKSFPNLEMANNKDKEDFIRVEAEKVAQELEAIN